MGRTLCQFVVLSFVGVAIGQVEAQPKEKPKSAFTVKAVINMVDFDKGVVVFTAGQMERSVKTAQDLKVLDASGKELAGGLRSQELKGGTQASITIEPREGKAFVKMIRLSQGAAPVPPKEEKKVDTAKLVPLTDLGTDRYQGFPGGLYPDGKNERPAGHEAAGLALAKTVQPLDRDGKPSKEGKIVLLGIGFSNTVQGFGGFMQVAKDDRDMNPRVVLVNGAVGGMSANMVQNPNEGRGAKYWAMVDDKLKDAGVTRAQVQVIWIKETNPGPHAGEFPGYIRDLQSEMTKIVQVIHDRFPNARLAYASSRTYGGWAKAPPGRVGGPGNSEPYSYETGFAVKWLIEQQLKGDAGLNYDAKLGAVRAPWLSWGPYLWANGDVKRKDGFSFQMSDFTDRDRMHHSPQGMEKVGRQLLHFFKTDATTRGWFLK